MNKTLVSKFKFDLQKIIGKECWGIVAGSGTGSVISLNIGDKIPLDEPIDNEFLSDDVRNNNSEFNLFIECTWRLDSRNKVVCGCWDDNSAGEKMLEGLNLLINSNISEIKAMEPAFDLEISFSNDLKLKVFCDQVNEEDKNDNYSFFTPEIIYSVLCKSILTTEKYEHR